MSFAERDRAAHALRDHLTSAGLEIAKVVILRDLHDYESISVHLVLDNDAFLAAYDPALRTIARTSLPILQQFPELQRVVIHCLIADERVAVPTIWFTRQDVVAYATATIDSDTFLQRSRTTNVLS